LTEPRRLVADLAATSRNWALTADGEARLRAAAPPGWAVDVVRAPTSSDGDGPQGGSDEAQRLIADAEVYFGFGITEDLFRAGRKLRWVHSAAAGVGNVLKSGIVGSEVLLTNSAGVHGPPIAEFVVAGILHFLRGLDVAIAQQCRAEWSKAFFVAEDSPLRELPDCRVLIVGAGGLGGETARRLSALGARCIGVRRRPEIGPPEG
jgi:phosphoglycerate dehydrogenase-like enzyme